MISLRLYVAGESPHSRRAISNLRSFIGADVGDRYELEIIDVLETPDRAVADRVFLTPQLVIASPAPARTLVGDLSDLEPLREAIGRSRADS